VIQIDDELVRDHLGRIPTDVPGKFDILVVRDAIVVYPNPKTERERGRDAATWVMEPGSWERWTA
jgi:hypothetical protein